MEEPSSKGEDILLPGLSSLPPRPSEIPTEAVSQGSLSGTALHAEASDNPRDSPLIAAAPTRGTTTSTHHRDAHADSDVRVVVVVLARMVCLPQAR
jgi:hypothetical protein